MKLIFVSGPSSAVLPAALHLLMDGHAVYIPGTDNQVFKVLVQNNSSYWRRKVDACEQILLSRCDGLFLCDGWKDNPESVKHFNAAKQLNKAIYLEGWTEPG